MVPRVSTQIAVRLPDAVVDFLDRSVADGVASSRAAIVTSALEREMRRMLAQHDAAVLAADAGEDDLDALVSWTAAAITARRDSHSDA